MPIFGDFGPKIVNFLILAKLFMNPILNVLTSVLTFVFTNVEPKVPNLRILDEK